MRIETPIVSAASIDDERVQQRHRQARDARGLLVERRRRRARAGAPRSTTSAPSPRHAITRKVAARDRQDRAEEVREEVRVQRAGRRDQHDTAGDAGVEDDRERLVAGRARRRARSHSIPAAPINAATSAVQHRRDAEQVAGGDAGERDVADAVADQAHLALDEEEADGRARARRRSRPRQTPAA